MSLVDAPSNSNAYLPNENLACRTCPEWVSSEGIHYMFSNKMTSKHPPPKGGFCNVDGTWIKDVKTCKGLKS